MTATPSSRERQRNLADQIRRNCSLVAARRSSDAALLHGIGLPRVMKYAGVLAVLTLTAGADAFVPMSGAKPFLTQTHNFAINMGDQRGSSRISIKDAYNRRNLDFEQRRELDALLAQKKKTDTLLAGVGVAAAAGAYVAYAQGLIG